MKKYSVISLVSLVIIAIGLLLIAGITLLFHSYTYATENIYNATGELVWASGTAVGSWRSYEWTIYLGLQRILVIIGGAVSAIGLVLFFSTRKKAAMGYEVMAAIFIALAIIAAIGFLTAFYPCYEMMAPARLRPMRCVWTMRVLLGVNSMAGAVGLIMLISRDNKDFVKGLNTASILLGILFLLIPQTLTGVCVVHRCVTMFQPFARIIGTLMLILPIINLFLLKRKPEDDEDNENDEK